MRLSAVRRPALPWTRGSGFLPKARMHLERLRKAHPGDAEIASLIGDCQFGVGDFESARMFGPLLSNGTRGWWGATQARRLSCGGT